VATDQVVRRAIVRPPSAALGRCELSYLDRCAIDVERAVAQHAAYVAALRALHVEVEVLAPEAELADATFVEDPAVVVDEVAVITNPGVASRRPEVPTVAAALAKWRTLVHIAEPATLEGGDVLVAEKKVFVGRSKRTNAAGIEELGALLAPHGYQVQGVELDGCLHLKTAVGYLGDGVFLVNDTWLDASVFGGEQVAVDSAEPFGANAVPVNGVLLVPASAPRTAKRLAERGYEIVTLDIGELEKAEAGLTCMSLRFRG
jgi:dimethylargininase